MLINIAYRDGRTELKHIELGRKLVGTRLYSVVIETSKEAMMLATDKTTQDWWVRHIAPYFHPLKVSDFT